MASPNTLTRQAIKSAASGGVIAEGAKPSLRGGSLTLTAAIMNGREPPREALNGTHEQHMAGTQAQHLSPLITGRVVIEVPRCWERAGKERERGEGG